LNPEKLGECSRELSVGEEYAKRLLRRFSSWDEKKRDQVVEKLVHGYPSHDYIIDYEELKEIGFQTELFSKDERKAVEGLFEPITSDKTIIQCVDTYSGVESITKNDIKSTTGEKP
jgi:hypothetical protein